MRALLALFAHGVDGVHVVLQVGVYRDGHGALGAGGHEPLGQRGLVAAVAVQREAGEHGRIRLVRLLYHLPGAVRGAVVHKENSAGLGRYAALDKGGELFAQTLHRLGQDLLLVITGYYNKVFLHKVLRKRPRRKLRGLFYAHIISHFASGFNIAHFI